MTDEEQTQDADELTSEEILKLAQAMKDNAPVQDEKQNVHTFLHSVVVADDTRKIANLKDDAKFSELGLPSHNVRGSLELARISNLIMDNVIFEGWFNQEAEATLATSLSREGFLVRQATVQTKAVADVTKRRKINKGMFGKRNIDESGGDPYASSMVQ